MFVDVFFHKGSNFLRLPHHLLYPGKKTSRKKTGSATVYTAKILEYAVSRQDTFWLGKAYFLKGIQEDYAGNYPEAVEFYEKAYDYFKQTNHPEEMARTQNNLGIVYYLQGKLDMATQHLLQAVQLAKQSRASQILAKAYNNLALVQRKMKNWSSAADYLEKSLAIKKQIKDTAGIISTYINLAGLFEEQKQYDCSVYYSQKALKWIYQTHDTDNKALVYASLIKNYFKKGDTLPFSSCFQTCKHPFRKTFPLISAPEIMFTSASAKTLMPITKTNTVAALKDARTGSCEFQKIRLPSKATVHAKFVIENQ